MLTPEDIERSGDSLIEIWDNLKNWITKDMLRRLLARYELLGELALSGSDEWQSVVYQEAAGQLEDLQRQIANTAKISQNDVRRIFEECGIKSIEKDNEIIARANEETEQKEQIIQPEQTPQPQTHPEQLPEINTEQVQITPSKDENAQSNEVISPHESPQKSENKTNLENLSERNKEIMQDAYERTNGEIQNFTRTTANSCQQEFIKELDDAYIKVATGAQSLDGAVIEAVDNVVKHQGTVTYPSGHTDTIEVAILRAVRTGIARMSNALAINNAKENGFNLVLVSSHLGARTADGSPCHANHEHWQGKPYSIEGEAADYPNLEEATGYPSDPLGLGGYNCRHSIAPFKPGMKNPFKNYDSEENKKAYELSQKQRKIEREIRKAKTEVMAFAEAVNSCTDETLRAEFEIKLQESGKRLTMLNEKYKQFCDENNLKTYYERTYVAVRGNNKRVVANPAESGIIKNEARAIDLFNYDESKIDIDKSPENILNDLETSSVGREMLSALEELPERPQIDYTTVRLDGLKGEQQGGKIIVYANSCKDLKTVVCTLIHEYTHQKYGIGQSQWSECVCVAKEIMHRRQRDYLLETERRMIINAVKSVYPELNWRKGGYIYGRKRSK